MIHTLYSTFFDSVYILHAYRPMTCYSTFKEEMFDP